MQTTRKGFLEPLSIMNIEERKEGIFTAALYLCCVETQTYFSMNKHHIHPFPLVNDVFGFSRSYHFVVMVLDGILLTTSETSAILLTQ